MIVIDKKKMFFRLVHSVSKNLSEHADKIDDALKGEVEAAINEAKGLSSEADLEEVKAKVAALSSVSMKIGQAMYSNAKKDGEGSDSGAGAKEAEYTENKDEKK
jgi:molecular chaperone DnaK